MINYDALKAEMPHKWKVQTASANCISCVAYVDSRQVQDMLDAVVGPANWQDRYIVVDGQLHCEIGIYDETKNEWVWKGDCGTESMTEKEKGQASDAFKRAAVKWGVGRFLYAKEIFRLFKDNIITKNGKALPALNGKVMYGDDLTTFIMSKRGGQPSMPKAQAPVSAPAAAPVAKAEPKPDTYNQDDKPERYNADKANQSYSKAHALSSDTMERVRNLNRDGKTGGEVLKSYLPKYNSANDTSLSASDLKTDEIVNSVIDFIDNSAPVNI